MKRAGDLSAQELEELAMQVIGWFGLGFTLDTDLRDKGRALLTADDPAARHEAAKAGLTLFVDFLGRIGKAKGQR